MTPTEPSDWYKIDTGTGRPLVLLHPGGWSSDSWLPVLDSLAAERRVIAYDIPGFGRTPPPPPHINDVFDWVLDQLAHQLDRAGATTPVDMAGNSMGGWIALEAAKRGLARSVVALSPAGVWEHGMPRPLQHQFRVMLLGCQAFRGPAKALLRIPAVRYAALYPGFAKPGRVSYDTTISIINAFNQSRPVLAPLLNDARTISFQDGQDITIPITIAYGAHDRMVHPPGPTVRAHLPAHTRWLTLPGCGHTPMSDNPELVARTILDATAIARHSDTPTYAA